MLLLKKMAKITTLISVVLLGAIVTINQINADCCHSTTITYLNYEGEEVVGHICYDGTKADCYYCGHRKCNVFGCNCAGGCRRNGKGYNSNEALRLFFKIYCVKDLNFCN